MDQGFAPGIGDKLRSYVYLLVDPRTGRAFFAGRGRNDRCFRHVQAARATVSTGEAPIAQAAAWGTDSTDEPAINEAANGGRTFPVLERIREIEATGRSVRIDILRYGLSADEARLVEAVARDAFGLGTASSDRADRSDGARADRADRAVTSTGTRQALPAQRTEATRLNTLLAKPAKIKRNHRVVLLRLGKSFGPGTSDAELDEAVRSGWKIGRRWIDPQSRRSPHWAFAVVDDVVRAVYRIDGWKEAEPTPTTPTTQPTPTTPTTRAIVTTQPASGTATGPAPTSPARWILNGERDPELERKYQGRNVGAYLSSGSQNPVTYVWCGPHWVNNPA
jgi:hypothetical protein